MADRDTRQQYSQTWRSLEQEEADKHQQSWFESEDFKLLQQAEDAAASRLRWFVAGFATTLVFAALVVVALYQWLFK